MVVRTFSNEDLASLYGAEGIAKSMQEKAAAKERLVLGLATGNSPTCLYSELVRMHTKEGLNFENVVTFNFDEFYPTSKEATESYHTFMHEHLFRHVNIKSRNIHLIDGSVQQNLFRLI